MSTSSTSHRLIRLPYVQVGIPAQVLSELLNRLKALSASNVFVTISDPMPGVQQTVQVECALSGANDTALVNGAGNNPPNFSSWATALYGSANPQLLDTEVHTTTSGH